jgi:NTE family protein
MERLLSEECDRRKFLKFMLAGGLALASGNVVDLAGSAIKKSIDSNNTPYQRISTDSPGLSLNLPEKNRPKIGLALGGGGLKGFAHFGVILSLIRNNIPVDYVSGTSIGAIVGAIYCSKKDWSVDEWEKVIEKVYNLGVFDILDTPDIGDATFQKHNKLEKLIKEFIPVDNFNQLEKPLSIVTTSLTNGNKKVFTDGKLIDVLLASSALPVLYPSVSIDNEELVDGGPKELVPTK